MKPRAGYAWSCAPCSKAHEDQVESFIVKGVAPNKNPSEKAVIVPVVEAAEGKGKSRAKGAPLCQGRGTIQMDARTHNAAFMTASEKPPDPNPDSKKWRTTNNWPFRYFGMHTKAETVLGQLVTHARELHSTHSFTLQILMTRSILERQL